ncbi:hypothetical protein Nepgr_028062 [Nepenthes gracilis]|uniref:Peptidase A1 domain-containing protein n=1 Tax=Nepenthes gracilis TaxID=150966 RepID=A0AAD3Y3Q8_NEPGR|nr:hypothetical protein Nepgr_028062 [Nepenthes gracilis]
MAENLWVCCLLLLSVSSLPKFTFASSRSLQQKWKTSALDVAASIQQTLDAVSFKPQAAQTLQQKTLEQQTIQSIASLTLQLYPRTSLRRSQHKDFKSLILSKFERDSARVKWLQARRDLAVNGIRKSDLKPLNKDFEAEALEVPVVSGTSEGSGEYFTRIGVGQPPSQVYVVLDTGSDVSWLQCEPCADCYQQADPIFRPTSSSSYAPVSCQSEQCKALDVSECRGDQCLYEVSYGDGSYTVGDFVRERITFSEASVDNIAIGCGHNNEGLFVGAAGLLGLGGGSLSFPSQINTTSFSYCLVDRDSNAASTLEFNSPLPPGAVTAPLLRNRQLDTFYYLGLTGISIGGELLPIPPSSFQMDEAGNGGVIIDSGTAVTRLQTEVYNTLRDAFVRGTHHLPSANGVALFDTCYNLASRSSVEVPTVVFHFPDRENLPLPAKNYLIPVDSDGTFCFAFAPTTSSLSIIGNVQQQGTRVGIDLANSLIGFSPNQC